MVPPIQNPCDFGTPEPCGVNPAFAYTRYPCDFDDPRPAQDTRGLPVIVDLQTPVKAEVVNRQRESVLAIEAELGIQPSGTFTTVRTRLDALEGLLCSIWNTINDSGSPVDVKFNDSTVVTGVRSINFLGTGITVTDAGSNQANILISGADGYRPVHEDLAVTFNGQTNFTLTEKPWNGILVLWIGGIKQGISEYNVSGKSLTWTGSTTILTTDVVEVLYWKLSTGSSSGGGANIAMAQQVFVAGVAQTNFGPLTNTPVNQESTELFIDGMSMTIGTDYTLSGNTIVYNNNPTLAGGEDVVVKYFYTP